jgi:molybdopterin molybdotransferase
MTILSFDEALARLLAHAQAVTDTDFVPIHMARGRVLAKSLVSSINVPPLDNSAMDGYALRCADVNKVGTCLPVTQRIAAGHVGPALVSQTARTHFYRRAYPNGGGCGGNAGTLHTKG